MSGASASAASSAAGFSRRSKSASWCRDAAPVKRESQSGAEVSGPERVPIDEAQAGDIVLINGIEEVGIGVTITDTDNPEALPLLRVDEPTLTMNFQVNTSPLAGQGRQVRHQPPDSRALDARAAQQRGAARRRHRRTPTFSSSPGAASCT